MQMPNYFSYLSICINASENLVMADNIVTPLNPLITPIKKEELEDTSHDVNVFQQLHEEKPFKRVVRTRVDHSAWDCQLFPNPHALTIYL